MHKKIFLLVDDDSDDTEMFGEALASVDSTIVLHTAVNGQTALGKLEELTEKPDIIFLDINMPVMNGWECLKALKDNEAYRHIPVGMISTSNHKREMEIAAQLGALCFMTKPSDFEILKKALKLFATNLGSGLSDALAQKKIAEINLLNPAGKIKL